MSTTHPVALLSAEGTLLVDARLLEQVFDLIRRMNIRLTESRA